MFRSLKTLLSVTVSTEAEEVENNLPYTEVERISRDWENILQAVKMCDNKISGAGGAMELLGIKPTTLASRLKNMGIQV